MKLLQKELRLRRRKNQKRTQILETHNLTTKNREIIVLKIPIKKDEETEDEKDVDKPSLFFLFIGYICVSNQNTNEISTNKLTAFYQKQKKLYGSNEA